MELVSDGTATADETPPVDFLIEYRAARSFLISDDAGPVALVNAPAKVIERGATERGAAPSPPLSSLDEAFRQEETVNAPRWTKWEGKQIETSIGEIRQLGNRTMISYSILNSSNQAIEIVPPQIQITGRKATKRPATRSARDTYRAVAPRRSRVLVTTIRAFPRDDPREEHRSLRARSGSPERGNAARKPRLTSE